MGQRGRGDSEVGGVGVGGGGGGAMIRRKMPKHYINRGKYEELRS